MRESRFYPHCAAAAARRNRKAVSSADSIILPGGKFEKKFVTKAAAGRQKGGKGEALCRISPRSTGNISPGSTAMPWPSEAIPPWRRRSPRRPSSAVWTPLPASGGTAPSPPGSAALPGTAGWITAGSGGISPRRGSRRLMPPARRKPSSAGRRPGGHWPASAACRSPTGRSCGSGPWGASASGTSGQHTGKPRPGPGSPASGPGSD